MLIQDNTLAAACYNRNSISELEEALLSEADTAALRSWHLTPAEYFAEIELALTAKRLEA